MFARNSPTAAKFSKVGYSTSIREFGSLFIVKTVGKSKEHNECLSVVSAQEILLLQFKKCSNIFHFSTSRNVFGSFCWIQQRLIQLLFSSLILQDYPGTWEIVRAFVGNSLVLHRFHLEYSHFVSFLLADGHERELG